MGTKRTICTGQTRCVFPLPTGKLYSKNCVSPEHFSLWLRLHLLFFITIWGSIWINTVSWAEVSTSPERLAPSQFQLQEDLTRFPQGIVGSQLQVLEDPSGSATLDQILRRSDEFHNSLAR